MGVTYSNPITVRDVSLAIEKFIIADFGTAWTPGRIDISSPPAGFRDLGPVDEESPTITISRSQFQVRTGIPQVLQFQAVTSLDARIAFNLQTRDTRAVIHALGSVPSNAAKYIEPSALTSIATGPTATIVTLVASPVNNWYVGDQIVTSVTTGGFAASQVWAQIVSINGLEVHFKDKGFSTAPSISEWVGKPLADFVPFGTASSPEYRLIGVADFIDGYQLLHSFDKVQASPEFVENLRASENNKMPFAFNAFGLESTTWANELVVGERYMFGKV